MTRLKLATLGPLGAVTLALAGVLGGHAAPAWARGDEVPHIPDEYETTSGHGEALNNGGYAATDSFSAIRANPALLASHKEYSVNAGYHWPGAGRDYFQGGIVDSKTSSVAAGVSYTGYTDVYKYPVDADGNPTGASLYDSPVTRRITLGLAQSFGRISAGIGATYVEAHPAYGSTSQVNGNTKVSGTAFNAGFAMLIMPGWSLGAAVENISNPKIRDYDPRTFKLGTAYQLSPVFTFLLDARQRDRVPEFEDQIDLDDPSQSITQKNPERLLIASAVAQVQDYLRLTASYGSSVTDDRRALAGGVTLVTKNFSLSYTASRPYMKLSQAHSAVTLSFDMAM